MEDLDPLTQGAKLVTDIRVLNATHREKLESQTLSAQEEADGLVRVSELVRTLSIGIFAHIRDFSEYENRDDLLWTIYGKALVELDRNELVQGVLAPNLAEVSSHFIEIVKRIALGNIRDAISLLQRMHSEYAQIDRDTDALSLLPVLGANAYREAILSHTIARQSDAEMCDLKQINQMQTTEIETLKSSLQEMTKKWEEECIRSSDNLSINDEKHSLMQQKLEQCQLEHAMLQATANKDAEVAAALCQALTEKIKDLSQRVSEADSRAAGRKAALETEAHFSAMRAELNATLTELQESTAQIGEYEEEITKLKSIIAATLQACVEQETICNKCRSDEGPIPSHEQVTSEGQVEGMVNSSSDIPHVTLTDTPSTSAPPPTTAPAHLRVDSNSANSALRNLCLYPAVKVERPVETVYTRVKLGAVLGGQTQQLMVHIPYNAPAAVLLANQYGVSDVLFPRLDRNPGIPTKPGSSGNMNVGFGKRDWDAITSTPTERTLFSGITRFEGKPGFVYMGLYQCTRVQLPDSAKEWKSCGRLLQDAYVKYVQEKNNNLDKMTQEQLAKNFDSGELVLPCVELKFLRYDHAFAEELSQRYTQSLTTTSEKRARSRSPGAGDMLRPEKRSCI